MLFIETDVRLVFTVDYSNAIVILCFLSEIIWNRTSHPSVMGICNQYFPQKQNFLTQVQPRFKVVV